MTDPRRIRISGTALPLRGDDIDTDRIIPARFLRCVDFGGLGEHLCEDDRKLSLETNTYHPMNGPKHQDAEVLLVNGNFGCGSSREHAPQAIMRWNRGLKAIVGESFAQIFFGNCTTLGVPCVTVEHGAVEEMMALAESAPETIFTVDLEALEVRAADRTWPCALEEGIRRQLVQGDWDSLSVLQEGSGQVAATAAGVPYFSGWR